jgi:hypothetical protein
MAERSTTRRITHGALAVFLLTALPLAAAPRPPGPVPLPPARPADVGPVTAAPGPAAPSPGIAVPLPPERPADLQKTIEDSLRPAPPAQPPEQAAEEKPSSPPACLAALAAAGVTATPRDPIRDGVCRSDDPLAVTAVAGVSLSPEAIVGCDVATGLAAWIAEVVRPAAAELLKAEVESLAIAGSYECRGRNRVAGAKLSEHAFGNALDINGVILKGRGAFRIGPQAEGSPEATFQERIRAGACAHFATVLGPGSDASHDDHLHVDQRGRRNGYRICQ